MYPSLHSLRSFPEHFRRTYTKAFWSWSWKDLSIEIFCCDAVVTQGDLEKSLGWNPVPLFDRERAGDMPVMQVMVSSCSLNSETSLGKISIAGYTKQSSWCKHPVSLLLHIGVAFSSCCSISFLYCTPLSIGLPAKISKYKQQNESKSESKKNPSPKIYFDW